MGNGIGVFRLPEDRSRQLSTMPMPMADGTTIVPNQNITSLARIAEAKAKFLKVRGEKETAVKQVQTSFGCTFL